MPRKKKRPKLRKKTRKLNKIKVLRRVKYFLIFIFILGIVTGVYALLFKSSYFELKQIEVNGEYPLTSQTILEATSIKKNESIWGINLDKVSDRLKEIYPEYKKVIVERKLPHVLIFKFKLRTPIAQIKSGRYFLVDRYGFILPQVRNVAVANLPIIKGIDSRLVGIKPGQPCNSKAVINTVRLLNVIQESRIFSLNDLAYIDASDFKNLFFSLENGIIVKIGNHNFNQRIKKLNYVLEEIKNQDVAYIDLRFKDPVLSPR